MLIYVTNRKLTNVPDTVPVRNRIGEIGVALNTKKNIAGDAIYFGLSNNNYSSIEFFPRGMEAALFNKVDPSEYSKPWVVLLHGYHQDVKETIAKARFLIEKQAVNVVLFSWPSRPKPVGSFDISVFDDYIKDFVKSVLFGFGRPSLQAIFVKEIKNLLKDLITNYEPARKNAELSTTDFHNALSVIKKFLIKQEKVKLSLFVHSMGNYLLQNTIKDKGYLPVLFSNILLHQADVNATTHAGWVPRLLGSASKKVYISVNVFDYVLAASNILHRYKLGNKNVERLGQSVRVKPDGIYQGYIHSLVEYLNFTDGFGIENKHEIFTCDGVSVDEPWAAGSNDIDDTIFQLIGRIIRSESSDGLPAKIGRHANGKGFSRMDTSVKIYKPRWIVEDENLCEEHESICFLDSLDDFEDPFQPAPVYDPELDD
ncbi:MAG: alpha/beta hydrolase [Gammaproteobacteria bacterium]|nr:alpha/beta hydrolase [Gammaproteobacteria bacterium]NNJ51371.1 alpha/beta hydrolase [Gammaproteobacteria bacterium]